MLDEVISANNIKSSEYSRAFTRKNVQTSYIKITSSKSHGTDPCGTPNNNNKLVQHYTNKLQDKFIKKSKYMNKPKLKLKVAIQN